MLGEEGRRGEGCQVGCSPVVQWCQAAFHCRHVQSRVREIELLQSVIVMSLTHGLKESEEEV